MKDSWPLLTASNGILLCWLTGSRGVPPISGSQTICLLGRKFGNPATLILLTGGCRPCLEGAGRATLTWSFLMKDSWPLLTASLACWPLAGSRKSSDWSLAVRSPWNRSRSDHKGAALTWSFLMKDSWHLAGLFLHDNACFSSGFSLSWGPPHFGL